MDQGAGPSWVSLADPLESAKQGKVFKGLQTARTNQIWFSQTGSSLKHTQDSLCWNWMAVEYALCVLL